MRVEHEPETVAGQELKRLRLARGWSQKEEAVHLEARTGRSWHQTTVARIEAGTRPLRVNELAEFAELFGVSVPHLLFPHISYGEAEAEIAALEPELKAAEVRAAEAEAALATGQKAAEELGYELNRLRARLDYLRRRRDSLKPVGNDSG